MRLLSRKGTVTVFEEDSKEKVLVFLGERRFELTREQFHNVHNVSQRGTQDDFILCLASYGITLDKSDLN